MQGDQTSEETAPEVQVAEGDNEIAGDPPDNTSGKEAEFLAQLWFEIDQKISEFDESRFELEWDKEFGEKDRIVLTANSLAHDDGSPFQYRLVKNKKTKRWEDKSDPELRNGTTSWRSMVGAKKAMQQRENELLSGMLNERVEK